MKASIGRLRHRVKVFENQASLDDEFEKVDNWLLVETRWGEVRPLSGTALIEQSQRFGEVTHQIRVRATTRPILPTRTRLGLDSRTFEVAGSYDMDERGRFLMIMATERVVT